MAVFYFDSHTGNRRLALLAVRNFDLNYGGRKQGDRSGKFAIGSEFAAQGLIFGGLKIRMVK